MKVLSGREKEWTRIRVTLGEQNIEGETKERKSVAKCKYVGERVMGNATA